MRVYLGGGGGRGQFLADEGATSMLVQRGSVIGARGAG